MKKIFLILYIITISIQSFAQDSTENSGSVDTENPNNYKSDLIQKIVSIPVQSNENKSFWSWEKSLFQFGFGQSYYRFNSVDPLENSISAFSDKGLDFNFKTQYYFFSFLSLLINYDHNSFQLERYDGQALAKEQRIARSLGVGIQFDIGDFIIGMAKETWNKPLFYLSNNYLAEDEYETEVLTYRLGHRTGIKNIIIEFFYLYSDIGPFNLRNSQYASGKMQSLGIEIFMNTSRTMGLQFSERFGEINYEEGGMDFKQFKVQPFVRF